MSFKQRLPRALNACDRIAKPLIASALYTLGLFDRIEEFQSRLAVRLMRAVRWPTVIFGLLSLIGGLLLHSLLLILLAGMLGVLSALSWR